MNLEAAREILLDHGKNPRNRVASKDIKSFQVSGECQNPLCGDHVKVYLEMNSDTQCIQEAQIQVKACTICTASASLMSEEVKFRSKLEIDSLRELFEQTLLDKSNAVWPERLGSFIAFSHLRVNPARIPCSLIPWYALKQALSKIY